LKFSGSVPLSQPKTNLTLDPSDALPFRSIGDLEQTVEENFLGLQDHEKARRIIRDCESLNFLLPTIPNSKPFPNIAPLSSL